MHLFFIILAIIISGHSLTDARTEASEDSIIVRKDYNRFFEQCNVNGGIVLFDYKSKTWITNDSSHIQKEFLPASSFKIINLLIALETGVIKDENEIMKFPGNSDTALYGYRPDIYHDMTIKEAFKKSAVWVFIDLAKKIGKDRYKHYLKLCDYGNLDLSEQGEDFWNFGPFKISPVNQVKFLVKLYDEKLPFTKRNMDIIKNVMISDQTENYTLRSKTGWTRADGLNIGWWVGYIERKEGVLLFATNLLQPRSLNRPDFASCRIEITKAVLKDLGAIP